MNYKTIYDSLISKRKSNPPDKGYTERHHIIMRSMGGTDDPENIVTLSGREHWIAHLLLHKIYRNRQTLYSCHMMAMRCEERGIPYVRNSRMYESIRIECAKIASINGKKRIGPANGSYDTMWICNIDLKENKKISRDSEIPSGWIKGRSRWKRIQMCPTCKKSFSSVNTNQKYCSKKCITIDICLVHKHFNDICKVYIKTNSLHKAFIAAGIPINGKRYKKFRQLSNAA